MHSLLERQLRKAGFDSSNLPTDLSRWQEFVSRIDLFYENADRERRLWEKGVLSPKDELTEFKPADTDLNNFELIHVLQAVSSGICVFDRKGQLLFANYTAKQYFCLFQTPKKQLLDLFTFQRTNGANTSFSTKELLQQLATKRSFQDHNASLQCENLTLPVACVFDPLFEQGQMVGFILMFTDMSEAKKVEKALIEAKETAEKASQAKSQFLSSMSHELRTPMNAILGYGELLKEELSITAEDGVEQDAVEDMQQYVGNILQAGWHLLELINEVLDLTKIESGQFDLSIEKTDLVELIKECELSVQAAADKRHITIHNKTRSLAPHYALADQNRLKQVLLNLLTNAIKYNQEAGDITLTLRPIGEVWMRLEVVDTGIGLTEEQQSKIFDPFTRLSGLNLIEGTGIGLTITKQLLELMDGHIGVESEPDKGSTFWLELPTGKTEETTLDTLKGDAKHILLYIEDSRTNVSLVSQVLKARPEIALVSAHTGEMGLELARMHHPDVILLDIHLPGMDGFEVLKNLRKEEATCHIPVLALSADDKSRDTEQGKEAGFYGYIIKPIDIKKFLKTVDNALQSVTEN